MEAVLLYNENQYNGFVEVHIHSLSFIFSELQSVGLMLEIAWVDIHSLEYYKLYDVELKGIEITTNAAIHFVSVVYNPLSLKLMISSRMK